MKPRYKKNERCSIMNLSSSNPNGNNDPKLRKAFYASLGVEGVENHTTLAEKVQQSLFVGAGTKVGELERRKAAKHLLKELPYFQDKLINDGNFTSYISDIKAQKKHYPDLLLLEAFAILTKCQLHFVLEEAGQYVKSRSYKAPAIEGTPENTVRLVLVRNGRKVIGYQLLPSGINIDELNMEGAFDSLVTPSATSKAASVTSKGQFLAQSPEQLLGNRRGRRPSLQSAEEAPIMSAVQPSPVRPITEKEREAIIRFYAEIGPGNLNDLLQELWEVIGQNNYPIVICSERNPQTEKEGTIYVFPAKNGQFSFALKGQPSYLLSLGREAEQNLRECRARGDSSLIKGITKNEIIGAATKRNHPKLNDILASIGKVAFNGTHLNASNFLNYIEFCRTQNYLYPEPEILYAYGALKEIQFSFVEMSTQGQYQLARSERYRPPYVLGIDSVLSGKIPAAKKAAGDLNKIRNISLLVDGGRTPIFQVLELPDGSSPTRQEMREFLQHSKQKKHVSFDIQTRSDIPPEMVVAKKRNFKEEFIDFVETHDPSINNPTFVKFLQAMTQKALLPKEIFWLISEYLTNTLDQRAVSLLRELKVENQMSGNFEVLSFELQAWVLDGRFVHILSQLSSLEKSQSLRNSQPLRNSQRLSRLNLSQTFVQKSDEATANGPELEAPPPIMEQPQRPSFIPPSPPPRTVQTIQESAPVDFVPLNKQEVQVKKAEQLKNEQFLRVAQVPMVANKLIKFIKDTREHHEAYFKQFLALASNFISPEVKGQSEEDNIYFYQQILAYLRKMENSETGFLKETAQQILADIAGLKHGTTNNIHAQFALRVLTVAAKEFAKEIAERTTWTQRSFSPDASLEPGNSGGADLPLSGASFSQLLRPRLITGVAQPLTRVEREKREQKKAAALQSVSAAQMREHYESTRMSTAAERPAWNSTPRVEQQEDESVPSFTASSKIRRKAPLDMGNNSSRLSKSKIVQKKDKAKGVESEAFERLTQRILDAQERLSRAFSSLDGIEIPDFELVGTTVKGLLLELRSEREAFEVSYDSLLEAIEKELEKQKGEKHEEIEARENEVRELELTIVLEIGKYEAWMQKKRVMDQEIQWESYFGEGFKSLKLFRHELQEIRTQLMSFAREIESRNREEKIEDEDADQLRDQLHDGIFPEFSNVSLQIEEQIQALETQLTQHTDERMSEDDVKETVQEVVRKQGQELNQLKARISAFEHDMRSVFRDAESRASMSSTIPPIEEPIIAVPPVTFERHRDSFDTSEDEKEDEKEDDIPRSRVPLDRKLRVSREQPTVSQELAAVYPDTELSDTAVLRLRLEEVKKKEIRGKGEGLTDSDDDEEVFLEEVYLDKEKITEKSAAKKKPDIFYQQNPLRRANIPVRTQRMDLETGEAQKVEQDNCVSLNQCLRMTCTVSAAKLAAPFVAASLAARSALNWATRNRRDLEPSSTSSQALEDEAERLGGQIRNSEESEVPRSIQRRRVSFSALRTVSREDILPRSYSEETGHRQRVSFLTLDEAKRLKTLEDLTLSGKALEESFFLTNIQKSLWRPLKNSDFFLSMGNFARQYGPYRSENRGKEKEIIAMLHEVSKMLNKEITVDTVKLAQALEKDLAAFLGYIHYKEKLLKKALEVLEQAEDKMNYDNNLRKIYEPMWQEKKQQYQHLHSYWERKYGVLRPLARSTDEEVLKEQYYDLMQEGEPAKLARFIQKLMVQVQLATHNAVTIDIKQKRERETHSALINKAEWSEISSVSSDDETVLPPEWEGEERENFAIRDQRSTESRLAGRDTVNVNYQYAKKDGKKVLKAAYAEVNGVRVEGVLTGDEKNSADRKIHAATILEATIDGLGLWRSNNQYRWPTPQNKITITPPSDAGCVYMVGALLALGVDFKAIKIDKRNLDEYLRRDIPEPEYCKSGLYSKLTQRKSTHPEVEIDLQHHRSYMVKEFLVSLLDNRDEVNRIKMPKLIPEIIKAREAVEERVESVKAMREATKIRTSSALESKQIKAERYVQIQGLSRQ